MGIATSDTEWTLFALFSYPARCLRPVPTPRALSKVGARAFSAVLRSLRTRNVALLRVPFWGMEFALSFQDFVNASKPSAGETNARASQQTDPSTETYIPEREWCRRDRRALA
jgi:hypothetical protein